MRKATVASLVCALMLCALALPATAETGASAAVTELIASTQAIKAYTEQEVEQSALDAILQAGAKAPSARNSQPWHFTVVQNKEIVSQLSRDPNGVLIIVSGLDNAGDGMNVDFDCGLATQNMYLAAQSLGLGANIVMGPVSQANGMKDVLSIPDGYSVVMILCVGHYDSDTVSTATPRNAVDDMTSYIP